MADHGVPGEAADEVSLGATGPADLLLDRRTTPLTVGLTAVTIAQGSAHVLAVLFLIAAVTESESTLSTSVWVWLLVVAWLATGLVVGLSHPWARRGAYLLRRLREPTSAERSAIMSAWSEIEARAGVRADGYRVAIAPGAGFASAGDTVVVPADSLDPARRDHLPAVLSHQLGQTTCLSWGLSGAVYWYTLPGWWAVQLGSFLYRAIRGVARLSYRLTDAALARFLPRPVLVLAAVLVVGCLAGSLVALVAPVALIWLLPVLLTVVPLGWILRRYDRQADTVAAELGYGPELLSLLSRSVGPAPAGGVGWRDRLFARSLAPVRADDLRRYLADRGL